MDFLYDDRTRELIAEVEAFMDGHVYPAEETFHAQIGRLEDAPVEIAAIRVPRACAARSAARSAGGGSSRSGCW